MREPYESLLGGLKDHWWLADFLTDAVPDWQSIAVDPRWNSLSDGEAVLLQIALAIYNGDQSARIADLAKLDAGNRYRAVNALYLAYG
jgi:hypothetical protein